MSFMTVNSHGLYQGEKGWLKLPFTLKSYEYLMN